MIKRKRFSVEYKMGKRIYLHTQSASYRAMKLYHNFGFSLLKKDKYGKAKNEYDEAMLELKKYLFPNAYFELIKMSKD